MWGHGGPSGRVASWEVVDGLDVDARVRRHGDPAGLDRVVDTHAADMDDPDRIGAFLTTPSKTPASTTSRWRT